MHLHRVRWPLAVVVALALALPLAGALAQEGPEGHVDAGANATMQPIVVAVSLDAGAHATPRVWNFLIEDTSGALVDSVAVSTSRDTPSATAATRPIANGDYVVRLLLGNHIDTACTGGTFYQVVAPAGGAAAVTVDGAATSVDFTFVACPDNPAELGVDYSSGPAPTSAGSSGGGADASFEATPAPPATGTGRAAPATSPADSPVPLLMLAAVVALAGVAGSLSVVRYRDR